MADGDPMVLRTLYEGDKDTDSNMKSMLVNGNLEVWSDTASMADGWTFVDISGSPTFTRQAGYRTSGTGDYFQRVLFTGLANATHFASFEQVVRVHGDSEFPSHGHDGLDFTMSFWIRAAVIDTGEYKIYKAVQRLDKDMGLLESGAEWDTSVVKGTWVNISKTATVGVDGCAYVRFLCWLQTETLGGGDVTVDFDDAVLYRTYTFDRNPSVPDRQVIIEPRKTFSRTINGLLRQARIAGWAAKHEKRLRFGMIDLDQLKELRSLWSLGVPMQLQANHPHFPEKWDCRFSGPFNFAPVRNLAIDAYAGELTLTGI